MDRRKFIKNSGLLPLPFLVPTVANTPFSNVETEETPEMVNFVTDGKLGNPTHYINTLQKINAIEGIKGDFYGNGGVVTQLEQKFAQLTNKEKAIYLPTGTMANQLALKLLSGKNTKVFVQENSHVYRDEADASQSVHHKRLIPIAKGKDGLTLEDLKSAIAYLDKGEVFKSGIGAISIESPVRRSNGKVVAIEEIAKIANYCKEKGYKLHLDGARIHWASAYYSFQIPTYTQYFDTVYISLYKYLGAAGGAILAGDKELIDQVPHLIKIHGGTVFQNWTNAAVALFNLENINKQLKKTIQKFTELTEQVNKVPGLQINTIPQGTNVYELQLTDNIDLNKFRSELLEKHQILISQKNEKGSINLIINESILSRPNDALIKAFKEAAKNSQ